MFATKRQRIRAALAVSMFAVAAGCAPKGVEPVHNLDSQSAKVAGSAVVADAHATARGFHSPGDAGFAVACYTTIPSTPTDADADGLPDDGATIQYTNCPEGAGVYSGSAFVQDGNPSIASFDFSNVVSLTVAVAVSNLSYSIQGTQTGSQSGGTFNLSDSVSVDGAESSAAFDGTWKDSHAWSVAFTPDDGTWVPAPGLPLENGTLAVSGAWSLELHPASGAAISVSGVTSATFTTAATCATAIVAGEAQIVLSGGSILHVTWTGCGATTTELLAL